MNDHLYRTPVFHSNTPLTYPGIRKIGLDLKAPADAAEDQSTAREWAQHLALSINCTIRGPIEFGGENSA